MSSNSGGWSVAVMDPPTGECAVRYVGDRIRFRLGGQGGELIPEGWRAYLRTNLGRAGSRRREIIASRGGEKLVSSGSWRDIPMARGERCWELELTLTEVGFFQAKAYAVDGRGWQLWPEGPDVGISVHPDRYRTSNTIYCVFPRLMGETKELLSAADARLEARLRRLDELGYAVLPPSGKLRDVTAAVPHMVRELGCRIVHLLPVNPTPTTYARFGRYGSPYAGLDLTGIDPALIEFDRRTTGVDQFRELADAVHGHGGRLVLDLVINHTGWSSRLQEEHPEWFLRNPDGTFHSPGAWGVTWEDLVELDERPRPLWDEFADAFLTWCRRGVDGFRCDAGYQVPMPVWQYAIARVRAEYPDTLFLLEGLGGGWSDTALLLTEGGMQWAYSELFQEFSGQQVSGYLDHAMKQSRRVGTLIHYSETHDNERLAKKGRSWSLLRNRLCALTSVSGGYGFTCGVEWLATEKIKVHGCTGLAWGNPDRLVEELARLNRLLSEHPCFFDGARLTRVSPPGSEVFGLLRESMEGGRSVLVLVNTDVEKARGVSIDPGHLSGILSADRAALKAETVDLLGASLPKVHRGVDGAMEFRLAAGASHCLGVSDVPEGFGEDYRRQRAQAAWGVQMLALGGLDPEAIGPFGWRKLARLVAGHPVAFLGSLEGVDRGLAKQDLVSAIERAMREPRYPAVVVWTVEDERRVTPLPWQHWLLLEAAQAFRARLHFATGEVRQVESVPGGAGHVAAFGSGMPEGMAELEVEVWSQPVLRIRAAVRLLGVNGEPRGIGRGAAVEAIEESALILLTNGRGGMARLCVDVGRITSKYDCLLGANLHPSVPVDRHVMAKRVRLWAMANGFLSPLDRLTLARFEAVEGGARWEFRVPCGDGRTTLIWMMAGMVDGQNTTRLRFGRVAEEGGAEAFGVSLTVRVDLEDRNFHWETKRNPGAEAHFESSVHVMSEAAGFEFAPAPDRVLRVTASAGVFHRAAEWSEGIPHPVEATRGMAGAGDAYSPGWFELPLAAGAEVVLVVTVERDSVGGGGGGRSVEVEARPAGVAERGNGIEGILREAIRAFVVRRGEGRTVIAGYPWFLDWGRDTLICARGLLAAGLREEVGEVLSTFGRFEREGTLPNTIHGDDASNRETSDAPLWFGLACEEWSAAVGGDGAGRGAALGSRRTSEGGRTLVEVLRSIAEHHVRGTAVGVVMDRASGLLWSPAHFTWMDTNHPACTPREGYPIEIQALWIRLLRQLERLGVPAEAEPWGELARRAEGSLNRWYWLEAEGWWADVLRAGRGVAAASAEVDDALRSNGLFVVSLGIVGGERARRSVEAVRRHLVVPGGVRSLAPLRVRCPLELRARDGTLLGDPQRPYWGRYEGDEDTRRKPAYHNGTAWVWMLPVFAEALVRAWGNSRESLQAAKSYLLSLEPLLASGCLGQLPEILDGDAPHRPRGCDAQAWSVTEALRVWRMVQDGCKG